MSEEQQEIEREQEQTDEIYKATLQALEDLSLTESWLKNEEWEPFRKAWQKIYELADKKLDNVSSDKSAEIAELQLCKRFYKDVMKTTVEMYRKMGEEAYERSKERGWLSQMATFLVGRD